MKRLIRVRDYLLDFPIGYFEHVPLPEEPHVPGVKVDEPHWVFYIILVYVAVVILAVMFSLGKP